MENMILRCDGCQKLVHSIQLQKLGCCHSCGNKRYATVQILKEDEHEQLRDKSYDFGLSEWPTEAEEFAELFEQVEDL